MADYIMNYLKDNFNFDYSNSFVRNTFINLIDYSVNDFNHSKDQLAYFLSDIFDEITFDEIKNIINSYNKEA